MTESEPTAAAAVGQGDVLWQRFSVPYEFPVAFGEGLFAPENPLLADTLALREPEKRHRCLVFVDEGALAARPGLKDEIAAYAAAHATRMELVCPPVAVAGGERIKQELTHLESIQDLIHETRSARHS